MTTAVRATSTKPLLEAFASAKRDSLIPILQRAQEIHGYLSEEAIAEIGRHLKLPASKVYGVATFYNQFRFAPKGKYHVMLCRGTACHVKGSLKLLDAVTRSLKLQPGQTTRDGMFSLEVVACMGACGLAPAMSVNGEMYAKVTPKKVGRILDECRAKEDAHVRS
jgi:NADH-quinone oxidoreductase E subunit